MLWQTSSKVFNSLFQACEFVDTDSESERFCTGKVQSFLGLVPTSIVWHSFKSQKKDKDRKEGRRCSLGTELIKFLVVLDIGYVAPGRFEE